VRHWILRTVETRLLGSACYLDSFGYQPETTYGQLAMPCCADPMQRWDGQFQDKQRRLLGYQEVP